MAEDNPAEVAAMAASPDEAPKPDTIANEAGEPHVTTEDPTKEGASQEAEPSTSAADDLPSLDDPELNAAATKIQAVQKGRKARADVAAMRHASESDAKPPANVDGAAEGTEDLADLDLGDPELNAAATKIQAVQKGRKARAEVETMKAHKEHAVEESDNPPAKVGKDAAVGEESDEVELNAAATKIQAIQKGRMARAEVASMRTGMMANSGESGGDQQQALDKNIQDEKLSLIPGMKASEVAEMFFKAVERRDYDIWLATLHMEARSHPTSRAPGPFWCQEWELLRERVRKQSVRYRLQSQKEARDGSMSLKYTPLYGDVPGYTPGEPMSKKMICLDFEKELNEWRIMEVTQVV